MKNEGGREAGKCSKFVPDHGDRYLFIFLWSRRLFCNVFLYPVSKAQLIGDWYENRRGGPNCSVRLFETCRMYASTPPALLTCRLFLFQCTNILAHWCPTPPIGNADQARCANNFFFLFGPQLLLAQGTSVRQWYWRIISKMIVFCAPHHFHTNCLLTELYKQETEICCRKDDGNIKK